MSLSRDTVSPSSDRSSIRSSANSLNSPSPEITACFQSSRQLTSSLARSTGIPDYGYAQEVRFNRQVGGDEVLWKQVRY